jgi:hypothetical protein
VEGKKTIMPLALIFYRAENERKAIEGIKIRLRVSSKKKRSSREETFF